MWLRLAVRFAGKKDSNKKIKAAYKAYIIPTRFMENNKNISALIKTSLVETFKRTDRFQL